MADNGGKVIGAEGIASQVPHRYPFLMLDRIVEQSPGRCVAIKNVTINEWYFQGHFPGRPVMPGGLLTEAMAQAGNFLGRQGTPAQENCGRVSEAFLLSAETKYIRPVVPGDQVVITARLIRKDGTIVRFKSEAHVLGELVASGTYVAMVKEDPAP